MKIQGIEPREIRATAARLGFQLYNERQEGRWFAFVLRPKRGSDLYRATGHSGRRAWAVCWHGHRAFMDALFTAHPGAKLRSVIARYDGAADYFAQVASGPAGFPHGFDATGRCDCAHPIDITLRRMRAEGMPA